MSKSEKAAELCKLPDTVKFQYLEGQEMNSSINIENLMDKIVTFRVYFF